MSRKEDLIERLKSKPKDFEIRELEALFSLCGCKELNGGRTSGSAIKFVYITDSAKRVFSVHRPHPENALKRYILDEAQRFLTDIGAI